MVTFGKIDLNKTKVIIFDFDETMYYSPTTKKSYIAYIRKTILTLNPSLENQVDELMDKYGFTSGGDKRISFGKNCEKFNVTKEQWDNYRIENFFQIDYSDASIVSNDLLAKLAGKYNLYIVSNEVLSNVEYKAQRLGIDLSSFNKVFAPTPEILKNYVTKCEVYKQIRAINNCAFDEMIVVGDRYEVDIKPLEELGGSGILSSHPDEIEKFFENV